MDDSKQLLFDMNGRLPALKYTLPMALQHLVAMIVGCVTPAIIISSIAGLNNSMRILLIQSSLVCAALSTLLQLFGITRFCGARLPLIMGVSFAYLATMQDIASTTGIDTIFGAQIIGGTIAIVIGIFAKLSAFDHRNRGIHNWSFTLSDSDNIYGRRKRKCILWFLAKLDCGNFHTDLRHDAQPF